MNLNFYPICHAVIGRNYLKDILSKPHELRNILYDVSQSFFGPQPLPNQFLSLEKNCENTFFNDVPKFLSPSCPAILDMGSELCAKMSFSRLK